MTRSRLLAAAVLVAAVASGLVVHLVLADTAPTDIAGDALYPVAVYAVLVLAAPRLRPPLVGAIVLVWCVGVELLQLTGVPQAAASVFPPAVLVLGTVFDTRDLVVYAVTTVLVTGADLVLARRNSGPTRRDAVSVARHGLPHPGEPEF